MPLFLGIPARGQHSDVDVMTGAGRCTPGAKIKIRSGETAWKMRSWVGKALDEAVLDIAIL